MQNKIHPDPSGPARRRDNSAATRAALLAAARDLFGKQGFDNTSLAQICAQANATTGSLYHHFGDKAGLFRAVFEAIDRESIDICAAAFGAAIASGGNTFDGMVAAHAAAIEIGLQPGNRRIFFRDAPTVLGNDWLIVHECNGYGAMIELVRQMQQSGLMIAGDPRRIALMIENLVFAAVQTMPEDATEARHVLAEAQQSARAMLEGLRVRAST